MVHRLWVYVVAAYGVTVMDGLEHVVQARLLDDDGCELSIDLKQEGLALQLEGCVDREFEFDGELTIPDAVFESNVLAVPVSATGTGGAAVLPRGYILGRAQVVRRCFSVDAFADEAWVHRTRDSLQRQPPGTLARVTIMTPRGERAVFAALPELSGDLRESWFEADNIGATFERTGARFPSFKALLTRSAHGQAVVMLSTPYWAMHAWPKQKEQDMFRSEYYQYKSSYE